MLITIKTAKLWLDGLHKAKNKTERKTIKLGVKKSLNLRSLHLTDANRQLLTVAREASLWWQSTRKKYHQISLDNFTGCQTERSSQFCPVQQTITLNQKKILLIMCCSQMAYENFVDALKFMCKYERTQVCVHL